MTTRLEEYQRKLGAPPVRLRNVLKAAEVEPVHQPGETRRCGKARAAWPWLVFAAAALALAAAAYLTF